MEYLNSLRCKTGYFQNCEKKDILVSLATLLSLCHLSFTLQWKREKKYL